MANDSSASGGRDEFAAGEEDGYVRLLLLVGPHARPARPSVLDESGRTVLETLRAVVDHVATSDEAETVAALHGSDHEAIVLDPGVLDHYSRLTADAVSRSAVPVVAVRQTGETEQVRVAAHRLVASAASASVQGGGASAYEGAVEAAAWLAWEGRHAAHRGDAASTEPIPGEQ